ncbi:MAG: tRNA (N6-isopentenyl adenosine(37)-C2)-methylthiotransferase MiaB [Bacteroidetes bacterium GWF2_49_14]|nr:MAG: tRNA (N6-isopentenyl adenosine(37)-C2)-methylthiotransferase MiaB [Bacteroidetes bacterium GWF2_49_14]
MPKLYIETYGCQMNVADSETVASILAAGGYEVVDEMEGADVVLVNTCSVRENAETRVFGRLAVFRQLRKANPDVVVGVLGCMAERVKEELISKHGVNLVAGPDSYRSLPELLAKSTAHGKAIDVELSTDETYAGICPTRLESNGISGFISITRGCNNFCTYCIVPYTRGRERSRDPQDILNEARDLQARGYKELTLLGQNVNSYRANGHNAGALVIPAKAGIAWDFPKLLEEVALAVPGIRIRFTTSHPKDMSDETLRVIARNENICKHIHLPVQSGSNRILKLMNRKYTREQYLARIHAIREIIPGCGITTDIFCGFPSETEEDHLDSLALMEAVRFDFAFMFKYSERPGTYAAEHLPDDISNVVKSRRLQEIIGLQATIGLESNRKDIGKTFDVLAEGLSKKSRTDLYGRNPQNKVIVFPQENKKPGELVRVLVTDCTGATLKGVQA